MPTINLSIELTDNELNAIKKVASKNKMSAVDYAKSVLRGAIKNAMRAHYKEKFKKMSLAEMQEKFGGI